MIKVFVVEDESPILRGICRMIEATDSRFTICGTAYDGEEALQKFATAMPDVVFTDINMPFCNGIELMQRIRATYPEIMVVVLSGYQEFAYAKSALTYGAISYLLKPLEDTDLRILLEDIAKRMACKDSENQRLFLHSMLYSSQPDFKGRFQLGQQKNLYVMLLCAGALPIAEADCTLPGAAVWQQLSPEDIANEVVGPDGFVWGIPGKSSAESILIASLPDGQSPLPLTERLFAVLNSQPVPVSLLSTTKLGGMEELSAVFRKLRIHLHRQIVFSVPRLLYYHTLTELGQSYFLSPDSENVLALSIAQNNQRQFEDTLETVLRAMSKHKPTQAHLEQVLGQIVTMLQKGFLSFEGTETDLRQVVYSSADYRTLTAEMLSLSGKFFQSASTPLTDRDKLIEEIDSYIQLNLTSPISNQVLSDRFGLVPSYISKLFKSQRGISPAEYIQKLRMEKAKELLIANPDIKTKDVALIVGYQDALYFSRVFKNETGVYPTQFRERVEG